MHRFFASRYGVRIEKHFSGAKLRMTKGREYWHNRGSNVVQCKKVTASKNEKEMVLYERREMRRLLLSEQG